MGWFHALVKHTHLRRPFAEIRTFMIHPLTVIGDNLISKTRAEPLSGTGPFNSTHFLLRSGGTFGSLLNELCALLESPVDHAEIAVFGPCSL